MELTIITMNVNYSLQDLGSFINSKGVMYTDLENLQEGHNYNILITGKEHCWVDSK